MAIDFLRTEILHSGRISDAMHRLAHYFAPFQTFVIQRAEDDESRFEQVIALKILESEAAYRARTPTPSGMFVYQFECIARNRLGYTEGLRAMAQDPLYSDDWTQWIVRLSNELGSKELSEVVYLASQHFHNRRTTRGTQKTVESELRGVSPLRKCCSGIRKAASPRPTSDAIRCFSLLLCRRQLDYPADAQVSACR